MTRLQTDTNHGSRDTEEDFASAAASDALRATLREQIRHRLGGGARGLEIDVCHASPAVFLTGVVSSFYAKQVLYQVCRRCAAGFRVIDSTVVRSLPA